MGFDRMTEINEVAQRLGERIRERMRNGKCGTWVKNRGCWGKGMVV